MADDQKTEAVPEGDPLAKRIQTLSVTLEPVTKGGVAALAICYALGLLIKNIYLARWSTFTAKLLEAEYVLSGALFMLLVLLGVALWNFGRDVTHRIRMRRLRDENRGHRRAVRLALLRTICVVLLAGFIVAIVLAFICGSGITPADYTVAIVSVLCLPAAVILVRGLIAEVRRSLVQAPTLPGGREIRMFLRALLLFATLVLYASTIYPIVSPLYGGGRHSQIRLRVTDDGERSLRDLGFLPESSHSHVFASELIFEDDIYLTLVAPRSTPAVSAAVRIRRDEISSILTRAVNRVDLTPLRRSEMSSNHSPSR